MTVKPRNGSFQADVKLGDIRYRPTFKTEPEAVAWEFEARAAFALGKPIPTPGAGQVKNAKIASITELIAYVEKKRWNNPESQGSVGNAYRFAEWVGPKVSVAEALTEEQVEAFVEHREDEHQNSGSTINRYMAAIRPLMTAAVKLKLIPELFDLPKRQEGQCRIRFYTEAEERDILTTLTQWSYDDIHDYFVFLLDTGMRPIEAKRLVWADISGRHIILEHDITKNSTQRVLTATPRVAAVLERMKQKFHNSERGPFSWAGPKQPMIRTLWERLRGHLQWMGKDTIIYTFRHTCASRLVQRGVDLYRVQIWMGHKSIQMTQRYAKFAPKQLGELADVLAMSSAPAPAPSL